ncbi:MAG: 30S ribosomal protein S1 [Planctomycetes bacterium]|nr:30S ribosomal protein S1 [Planctomycetota bacterium]
MPNELLKQFSAPDEVIDQELANAFQGSGSLDSIFEEAIQDAEVDSIIKGRVVSVGSEAVMVDVGLKSEGIVPLSHFDDPEVVKEGDTIDVLLEAVEDDEGLIILSKRKADRIRGWENVISTYKEGDVVRGRASRKIKGGLLLEIGVPVFLPASQIDIRRVGDVGEFIGKELECKIIKIDEPRMNIVVSRRKLLEEVREEQKSTLMKEIEVGQVRKGVVKNITDFGAFVDLGGIDGLLHITDMSWGRINHPSELLKINDEIDVKVLKVDKERERISLGLKQTQASPWENIEERYPIGSKVKGNVVNVLSYGAFVELEDGIEGLVHVSEMSWTRRINHPSAMVKVGDELEVVVLDIKKDKQEISLGMKQVEVNPWTLVAEKYPTGTLIEGTVRNLTNYGAFIEIEEGIDGLLHVSDMSWTRKVVHPSEMLKKGDHVRAVVLQVDQERKRVALGLKQMEEDPWLGNIPDLYQIGTVVRGKVTKTTNFGVFVQLDQDLEGLLHISELSDQKINSPEEVVKVGDKVDVKVIKIDGENRKIGLSLKDVTTEDIEALNEAEEAHRAELAEQGLVLDDDGNPITIEEAERRAAEAANAPPPAEVEETAMADDDVETSGGDDAGDVEEESE